MDPWTLGCDEDLCDLVAAAASLEAAAASAAAAAETEAPGTLAAKHAAFAVAIAEEELLECLGEARRPLAAATVRGYELLAASATSLGTDLDDDGASERRYNTGGGACDTACRRVARASVALRVADARLSASASGDPRAAACRQAREAAADILLSLGLASALEEAEREVQMELQAALRASPLAPDSSSVAQAPPAQPSRSSADVAAGKSGKWWPHRGPKRLSGAGARSICPDVFSSFSWDQGATRGPSTPAASSGSATSSGSGPSERQGRRRSADARDFMRGLADGVPASVAEGVAGCLRIGATPSRKRRSTTFESRSGDAKTSVAGGSRSRSGSSACGRLEGRVGRRSHRHCEDVLRGVIAEWSSQETRRDAVGIASGSSAPPAASATTDATNRRTVGATTIACRANGAFTTARSVVSSTSPQESLTAKVAEVGAAALRNFEEYNDVLGDCVTRSCHASVEAAIGAAAALRRLSGSVLRHASSVAEHNAASRGSLPGDEEVVLFEGGPREYLRSVAQGRGCLPPPTSSHPLPLLAASLAAVAAPSKGASAGGDASASSAGESGDEESSDGGEAFGTYPASVPWEPALWDGPDGSVPLGY